jgi:hypothetical protein
MLVANPMDAEITLKVLKGAVLHLQMDCCILVQCQMNARQTYRDAGNKCSTDSSCIAGRHSVLQVRRCSRLSEAVSAVMGRKLAGSAVQQ